MHVNQALRVARYQPVVSRTYRCQCGRPVFFRNNVCLGCNAKLGYEPTMGQVCSLQEGPDSSWQVPGRGQTYRLCGNADSAAACNWLVPRSESNTGIHLCSSCRLNRTIPDLSVPENRDYWLRIETAKRRLVSSLMALGLPVASRVSEDPERGLAFDFLRPTPGDSVITRHASGIITLNIEEADDSTRERVRQQMHEPYRTLLGHLRHEIGHYYWQRLIQPSALLNEFREIFGDENQDYPAALERYHRDGAPADWQDRHVSSYASVHPWEDFAETWAHYLHLIDTLDTAFSYRLEIDSVELPFEGFRYDSLARPNDPDANAFLRLLNEWVQFTAVLNELSRSMGLPDFYPFVLSRAAVRKLHWVHTLIEMESCGKRYKRLA